MGGKPSCISQKHLILKKNLPILTGIRFFAAFYVFIFHVDSLQHLDFLGSNILSIVHQGAVGVNIFFILSGFILFYNYYNRPMNFVEFIFKRLAKIYPVYLAGFFLMFAVTKITYVKVDSFFEVMVMNLLMIQSYLPKFAQAWYGGGSWSLSTEFFFYLSFPLLVNFISKLSKKRVLLLSVFCFILSVIPGALYHFKIINFPLSYAFPPSRVWEFIIGMLVACLVVKYEARISNFFICAIIVFCILFFHYIGLNLRGFVIQNIIVIPLMVVILISSFNSKSNLLGFLGWRLFEYLGKISYSFYIFQIPFLAYMKSMNDLNNYSSVSILVVLFVMNLAGAAFLYHLIELPSHKFLNKKIKEVFVKKKPILS